MDGNDGVTPLSLSVSKIARLERELFASPDGCGGAGESVSSMATPNAMSPLRPRDLAGEWCHDAAVSITLTDGEDTVGAGRLPWVPGDAVLVWSRGMGAWRQAVVVWVAWPVHRRISPKVMWSFRWELCLWRM